MEVDKEEKEVEKSRKNKASSGQVTLTQMLRSLDKDLATNIERRLKKLTKKRALQKPLDKSKADQLERKAAYSAVNKEVSKWEPIVERYRHAKQIKFPLDQEEYVLPSTAESLGELKPINELEKEVQSIVNSCQTVLHDNQELTKAEEKYLSAISVEEAQERHRELQRMRVLLSSYASKMRRQKAIKSKSYRRLLKHERIRSHMKKVESNKDLLVEEIERLQRLRAQERASLKHKNTGKWAKHAKFRAKYDDEARQAMLEQIGLAKKFLEKPAPQDESDESDDDEAPSEISESEQSPSSSDTEGVSDSDEETNEDGSGDEERKKRNETVREVEMANDRLIISNELINDRSRRRRQVSGDDEDNQDDEMGEDEDHDEDQRRLMAEAFANDDVVAEFERAKEKIAEEEQPKDVDNFLPGWGNWAGPGLKVDKKKRKKYIIKAKKVARRDEKLGNVIISEQAAEGGLKEKMIKKLPRGFKSDDHLAKVLTKPTASTFVDQRSHRDLIRPRIETKLGARIEPLSQKVLQGNKAKWA